MPKKMYVSGPITGMPNGNVDTFRAAERYLAGLGYHVVVPHDLMPYEHDGSACPPSYARGSGKGSNEHTSAACFLRADLIGLLACDAIFMLRGWERSVGARLEFDVAALCGFEIYYQPTQETPEVAR